MKRAPASLSIVAAIVVSVVSPAVAQTTAPAKPVSDAASKAPPTQLQGVEVLPPQTPEVISTYPANGASAPGGTVILKIVFDRAMEAGGWSYGPSPEGELPNCLARPRLLADQKTFDLLCSLPVGKTFAVQINAAPDFVGQGARPAKPYLLKFSTNGDTTEGLHDALVKAGLTDADDPIMDWTGKTGVSNASAHAADGASPGG